MLRRLRVKFVTIIMALVGLVLFAVVGGSLIGTYQTYEDVVSSALDRGLEGDVFDVPSVTIGGANTDERGNLLVVSLDIDESGNVIARSNQDILSIDTDTLSEVLSQALTSTEDHGTISDYGIVWKRRELGDGTTRVAIVDNSASLYSLRRQAVNAVLSIVVGMVALFVISWFLSAWVLKPVEEAWNQQRQFVSDASHELKTPLAVILANTQILSNDESIPSESRRWIESTQDEAQHMKSLVEQLLELARTDERTSGGNQSVMRMEDVDLSEVVELSTLEFDAIAFENGSFIEDDIAEDLHVTGDRVWLDRLAKILVENACKYTAAGSPIKVTLSKQGRVAELRVNNHGNVMSPEDVAHAFDRFYRSDKARSRSSEQTGFGLGLAIAKGIAESHHGTIACQSDEVEGTTFCVRLPLA